MVRNDGHSASFDLQNLKVYYVINISLVIIKIICKKSNRVREWLV